MSNNIQLSKQVSGLLKQIAKNDGGKDKKEIDSAKGYEELCNLLSGNNVPKGLTLSETERAYINTLKTQYEEKYIPQNMRMNNMNMFNGNKITITPFPPLPYPNLPPEEVYEEPKLKYIDA